MPKKPAPSTADFLNPVQMIASAAVLANALILFFPLAAGLVERSRSELYYVLVQEDGALEWMTFWAFILAAVGFVYIARGQRRAGGGTPWLTIGVALFCFVVAMEEISWGQRVLGYRPPEYFLKENFQQELNLHNVMSTSFRKLALKGTILGYGVILPLLALAQPIRKLVSRFGPQVSPLGLIPSFAITFWIYDSYPWRFSGEIVEMMLGLGFLFAACTSALDERFLSQTILGKVSLAMAATLSLGLVAFAYSHFSARNDPARIESATTELEALARDFKPRGRPISKCGVHKRVFSWAEKYRQLDSLAGGRFAGLVDQGLPDARAQYFIDPWNSPIWIRHKCSRSKGREMAFLYSFGPNRRRNSSDWEIGGDDIGIVLVERRR
ncbi:MAG: hypothetical protein ACE5GX_14030 [Thermoanaerobaculia bacterium]